MYGQPWWTIAERNHECIYINHISNVINNNITIIGPDEGNCFIWIISTERYHGSCSLIEPGHNWLPRMIVSPKYEIRITTGGSLLLAILIANRYTKPPLTNSRRCYILYISFGAGPHILIVVNVSIFRRPGYGWMVPDIPLTSEGIVNWIPDWRSVVDHPSSNH